jgi:mercuric ion transport protein
MKAWLEKSSSIGALLAAAACPVCFPKLALIGALFGLGALGAYEYQLFIAAQALVVIAVVGHAFSYRKHRNPWLLGGAAGSGAAVFAGFYLFGWEPLVYIGFVGLIAASATEFWNRLRRRRAVPQANH